MSLLTTGAYKDAYERVIAKSTTLCEITNVRSIDGEPGVEGAKGADMDWFMLSLRQQAKTVDGEVLEPGFFKEVCLMGYRNTGGDAKKETTTRIAKERMRELVVHALGLPVTIQDAHAELEKRGGGPSLIGKLIGVEWGVGDNGRQNINHFLSPAAFEKKES